MSNNYQVNLVARNEGIEYCDENGVYRFDISLKDNEWTIFIPGSKGESYKAYELSDKEKSVIIPRMIDFLKNIKWFGLIRKKYTVKLREK